MYRKITKCRVCGNSHYTKILDLGDQYLTGLFPKHIDLKMHSAPLVLVKCDESYGGCGHVQLQHTFDLSTMYGDSYGYRSGLNAGMVAHLKSKYERIIKNLSLKTNDIVVDIAGNDGTFLSFFSDNLDLWVIDPTSRKFSQYIPERVHYIADFFSSKLYFDKIGFERAKLVTSFSMFYDLEDPCEFARQVNEILDPNEGMWVLEQSYMPEMLRMNSFDTICQEHLSYYGMRQLKYIMDRSNFKIIDFEFNDVNGGSISLVVANRNSKYVECTERIESLIFDEFKEKLHTIEPWIFFSERVDACRSQFFEIIRDFTNRGKKIAGLGASTKGNVLLQTWNVGPNSLQLIGDVNPDKDGAYTPGTWIPIRSEEEALSENYDAYVVLPWHFKKFFLSNPKFKGRTLIFPLPNPEVVEVV